MPPPASASPSPRRAPQSPQNFLPAGFSAPHEAHLSATALPQSPQKRLPSGLSAPHCPQRIASPYRAGGNSRSISAPPNPRVKLFTDEILPRKNPSNVSRET